MRPRGYRRCNFHGSGGGEEVADSPAMCRPIFVGPMLCSRCHEAHSIWAGNGTAADVLAHFIRAGNGIAADVRAQSDIRRVGAKASFPAARLSCPVDRRDLPWAPAALLRTAAAVPQPQPCTAQGHVPSSSPPPEL
ncbi:hypothetical protein GUJ93_ZPchr0003g16964 [Zizania palustris]|uniref:Uncharacterized protein n=1 Tax=Zizania palustris TaxID=103762 RepID=A0A8J5S8C3_ZIZPA|nr:hypothetical protein GUJ93_ZPchr0003g16964 [Zizania palustris]